MKNKIIIAIFITFFSFEFLQFVNPFGLDQVIEWGMRPPYHWVKTGNSVSAEEYIGVNGKICATIYNLGTYWHVFGFGFSKDSDYDGVKAIAEKECQ